MDSSHRPSWATTVITWLALAVVAILVALGVDGVAANASFLTAFYPDLERLQTLYIVAGVAFGLCVEVLLVVTAVLVGYIRSDRIFSPESLRLVDVLVITVGVATALVIAVLPFIPGPPELFLSMVAAVLIGVTIVLVLLVMRSLLRRAVSMHIELDEVV